VSDRQIKIEILKDLLKSMSTFVSVLDELAANIFKLAAVANDIDVKEFELKPGKEQPEVIVHDSTGTCPECENHNISAFEINFEGNDIAGYVYQCNRCDCKWVNNENLIETRHTSAGE
jgi:DNA-directed RNA polymerase subunit M/transcription elongation factor TFIIS